jgi:hypothetical protein
MQEEEEEERDRLHRVTLTRRQDQLLRRPGFTTTMKKKSDYSVVPKSTSRQCSEHYLNRRRFISQHHLTFSMVRPTRRHSILPRHRQLIQVQIGQSPPPCRVNTIISHRESILYRYRRARSPRRFKHPAGRNATPLARFSRH